MKLAPGTGTSAQRYTRRLTAIRAATSGIVSPADEWPTTTTSPLPWVSSLSTTTAA